MRVYVPTIPKRAVKMLSMKTLANVEIAGPQPRRRAAAAGDGHVGSVTNAGVEALKYPQHWNFLTN